MKFPNFFKNAIDGELKKAIASVTTATGSVCTSIAYYDKYHAKYPGLYTSQKNDTKNLTESPVYYSLPMTGPSRFSK